MRSGERSSCPMKISLAQKPSDRHKEKRFWRSLSCTTSNCNRVATTFKLPWASNWSKCTHLKMFWNMKFSISYFLDYLGAEWLPSLFCRTMFNMFEKTTYLFFVICQTNLCYTLFQSNATFSTNIKDNSNISPWSTLHKLNKNPVLWKLTVARRCQNLLFIY